MRAMKSLLAGVAVLVGTIFAGGSSDAQYAPYPYYRPYAYGPAPSPYTPAQSLPPSWGYDPYTSGLGPCPQRRGPSDPPCSEQMLPSYGQPSFWSR